MLSYPSVPDVPTLRIATDADGVTALQELVNILTVLAHPSVVALESTKFEKTRAEVTLVEVTGTALAPGMELEHVVKATASAAAAIAHAHDHGIALHVVDVNSFIVRKDFSAVLAGLDAATRNASLEERAA